MQIEYENHLGERIKLNTWPIMLQNPEILFNNKWSYTQGSYGCMSFSKEKQEIQPTLQIFAESKDDLDNVMNLLLRITETDTSVDRTGRLWIRNNNEEWYLECNIAANDYTNFEEDFYTIDKKITILASKWVWNKEIVTRFRYEDNSIIKPGHGYPYGYPYGYRFGSGHTSTITNDSFSDSDMIITIYGYVYHPEIVIGGHTYKLNCTVENNQKAVINTKDRTIRLYDLSTGIVRNLFMYRDLSNYIFEKLPTGEHSVFWNANCNFDITVLMERSEPGWM
jgi:hypothetical protein